MAKNAEIGLNVWLRIQSVLIGTAQDLGENDDWTSESDKGGLAELAYEARVRAADAIVSFESWRDRRVFETWPESCYNHVNDSTVNVVTTAENKLVYTSTFVM